MSVPSSIIYILSDVPLNNSYEHSLYFPTRDAQEVYFIGFHREKTFNKFQYLRPENAIKVAGDIANARRWNYLMFQNDKGKWYYHFITKVEYTSDNSVKLHLELDVLQTYMFDWELHQCFIEREHTATDDFGQHTIDEGLESGPLIDKAVKEYTFNDMCILMLCAVDDDNRSAWSRMYDGVYSGLEVSAVDKADYKELGNWLDSMSAAGKIDAVVTMWMYPKELVQVEDNWAAGAVRHRVMGFSKSVRIEIPEQITDTLNGYTPRNKKTLCYPYSMLYVSNNMGGSAMYRRERFTDNETYTFWMMGALSPDAGVQIAPAGYNGCVINYEEALSLGAFPTCAWDSDTYKVWLAQNQHSQETALTQAKIQAGVGLAGALVSGVSGNLAGALGGAAAGYSALTNIQNLMAQRADMEVQPPQARGNHSGNVNIANGLCGFSFHFKTVTSEYARAIDHYFSRYGYKVNRVDTPSLHNRERFTYVKTQGCFVTGPLGAEDQLKVQAIFDKGITWWSDLNGVGTFTGDNPCL